MASTSSALSSPSATQSLLSTTTNPLVYHLLQMYAVWGGEGRTEWGQGSRVSGPRIQSPLRFCKDPWRGPPLLHCIDVPSPIHFCLLTLIAACEGQAHTFSPDLCLLLCLVPGPAATRPLSSFPIASLCRQSEARLKLGVSSYCHWSLLFSFPFTSKAWFRCRSLQIILSSLNSTENEAKDPLSPQSHPPEMLSCVISFRCLKASKAHLPA